MLLGEHILNGGFEYKTNNVNNIFENHAYLKQDTNVYYEYFGNGFGEVSNRIPAIFIQDSRRILPGLTINLGARWENQTIIGSDGNVAQKISVPIQPRVGIVFLPDNDGTQKFFASHGRFSQEFGLFQSVNYHSKDGMEYYIYFDHDPREDKSGGFTVFNSEKSISPEIEDLRGQYYDELTMGYERLIGRNIKLSIQGLYRTLREAIDDIWLASESRHALGNPGRGIFSEYPRPQRDYTALIFTIERRLDERFNFLASYVLSRDYGNYEGLFDAFMHSSFPNDNFSFNDPLTARENATGLLPNDRTHVFKFSGSYSFPFGLSAGISFIAQSGTPLSEYAGTIFDGIKFLSKRGSSGKTPAIWDLNARLMYEFPFQSTWQTKLILDLFHIASQRKPVDIDQRHYNELASTKNPTYGQAYRYQPSLSARFGIEVNF